MKSSILGNLVVTLGLSAAFGPIALMAQGEIRATIPFDFNVGAKSFAAGQYSLQQVGSTMFTIRTPGHSGVFTNTIPSGDSTRPGMAVLTFRRYGSSYFLSEVSNGSRCWELYQSAAEKQVIAKNASPKRVVVAGALPGN